MSSDGTSSTDLTELLTSIAGFTTIFEDLFALEVTAANSAVVQAQNASTFAADAATSAASASSLVATVANDATAALTNATNAGTSATTAASAATQAAGSATTASTAATTAQNAAAAAAAVQTQLNALYEFSSSGGTVTLSAANASAGIIWVQGNLTSNLTIVMPATVHPFILDNSTTGAFTVTVQMTGGSSAVSVGQGNANQLFCDGSTGIYSVSSVSGLQFTGVRAISAVTNALTNQYQGAYTPMSNSSGSTYTATLPQGATMGVGGAVFLDAITGKWSVKPNGSDTADFGTAYLMNAADKAMFTWNGSSWRTTMYTNQSSPAFSVSLTVPVAYITRGVFGGVSDDGTTAVQATTGRFTTSLTVPTMALGDNSFNAANTAFVYAALNALIGGAPGNLDTLNELAQAINDDTSFAATMTNLIATKAAISGQTFTGQVLAPSLVATGGYVSAYGWSSNTNKGMLYLSQNGANYLLWDGTNYNMPNGNLLVNGSAVWTAATFAPASYAKLSASNAFSGWISSTESGGGLSAAIAAAASNTALMGSYSTGAGLALKSAATTADQSVWDIGVNGTTLFMRAVNDAASATTTFMDVYRTGYTVTTMVLMPSTGRILAGPNVADDTYTPVQVSAGLSVQRIGGGGQNITIAPAPVNYVPNATNTNNVITSYSNTGNAKSLTFNSTTDTLDTPLTAGALGIVFQIYTKQIAQFSEVGNLLINTGVDDATNKLQVQGGVRIGGTGNGLTYPDGTTQTTAYVVAAPTVNTYTPLAGATVVPCQAYGLNLIQVFEAGSYLVPGVDYTASTGNSITLANAANGRNSYTIVTGVLFNASNVIQPAVATVSIAANATSITLPSATLVNYLWIYQNGSWLVPGIDFTFNGGTAVTLTTGPTQASDVFTLIMLQPVSFANTATQSNVQAAQLTFAMDTGAANVYAVAYLPAVATPTNGMQLSFFIKTTNTGASTLACNGGTAYPIYGNGHSQLSGGELVAGGFAEVVFSTPLGSWILLENSGGSQQMASNLNFTGLGTRITADMSNATLSNRLYFQTNTVNNPTVVGAMPNGTGASSGFAAFNGPDANNSGFVNYAINASYGYISSNSTGSGTILPLAFLVGGTERMRITTTGLLGINATAPSIAGTRLMVKGTVAEWPCEFVNSNTNGSAGGVLLMQVFQTASQYVQFFYNTTIVGSITTNGSSTTFGTTSDYRLKENITPLTGAMARVMQAKVIRYNFKSDEAKTEVDGFLAHELAEVVPTAVVGEKDKVEYHPVLRHGYDPKDVKPHDVLKVEAHVVPQMVDHSKMVPLLTAALQEANSRIEVLERDREEMKKQIQSLIHHVQNLQRK